jgi:ABC-type amino acid transport substrate-binding protein
MKKGTPALTWLALCVAAVVALAGQLTHAQTPAKPTGADKTKITDWGDPRPAAWTSKYPLFGPVSIGDGSLKRVQDAGVLKICADNDSVPSVYLDPKTKQLIGFEVEMANYLAPVLGIARVQWVDTQWPALIPSLQANKCDLISDGLAIRSDRAKAPGVRFTTPYFLIFDELVVRKDSTVKGVEDLKGQKICSLTGSTDALTLEAVLKEKNINAEISTFNNFNECFLAVSNKTIAAAWADQGSTTGGLKQYQALKVVGQPQSYMPTGKFSAEATENPYVFGSLGGVTHMSDNDLNLAWSVGLRQMIQNGTLEGILKKYDLWHPEIGFKFVKPTQ